MYPMKFTSLILTCLYLEPLPLSWVWLPQDLYPVFL